MPDLSVIIVSYNTCNLLEQCLNELLLAAQDISTEIIVVDNGSTDGSREYLESLQPDVRAVLKDTNLGFAAANNIGMDLATAPIILLLNSDAFVTAESIQRVMYTMRFNPRIGLAGVQILNPDGTIQAEDGTFPTLWQDIQTSIGLDQLSARRHRSPGTCWPVDWVHGACMFVRRSTLSKVGGLDERFFMYSEEVEWCRRFWSSGYQVWYVPEATAIHLGGASSRSNDLNRRIALYQSRLGLRRCLAGPHSSFLLWLAMLAGMSTRLVVRPVLEILTRHGVGRQSAASDWELLCAIAQMDPLARYVAT